MEQLLDVLSYKREILTQLLLVASIFGGFAVNGVMAFLSGTIRGRLANAMYVALSVAALSFIAATLLDAIMLPGMSRLAALRGPRAVNGLLALGDVVVYLMIVGSVALISAVAGSGFLYSRRVGLIVLAATVLVTVVAGVTLGYLAVFLG